MGLKEDFQFYLKNQEQLVKEHNGKVLAIKDGQLLGVYDTELQALTETGKKYEKGTFLIQRCSPGENNTKQVFHSRVCVA